MLKTILKEMMKKKLSIKAVLIFLCLLGTISLSSQIIPDKAYKINSYYRGFKALSILNSYLGNNTDVVGWTETNVPAQRWIISSTGEDNLYYLTNAYNGRPLSESSTRPKPGDKLVLKSNNQNYSKWKLIPVEHNTPNLFYICFSIPGAEGDLYAELSESKDSAQVKLQYKRDANDANAALQIWRIAQEDILPNRVTPSMRDSVMRGWKSRYYNMLKNSTGFWGEAEMMETILDAYETTGKQEYKNMFEEVYEHFVSYPAGWYQPGNGQDWRWNEFNDDIAWAVLASVRAYLMFETHPNTNINYLTIAKNNYDWMYARAKQPNGMLRWKQSPEGNLGSNSCINGPATIAACYLAIATGDESYYTKAKDLYALQRQHLYESATGRVFDSGAWENGVFTVGNRWVSTYNQGTFLGAALMLYNHYGHAQYQTDADKVMSRTRADLCNVFDVVKVCGSGGDLQGFKGILMRYVRRYIVDLERPEWVDWMQTNALHAYNNRNSKGVSWTGWWEKTSENFIFSDGYDFTNQPFGASTAVSAAFNAPLSKDLIVKDAYQTIDASLFDYIKGVLVDRTDDSTAIVTNIRDGYYTAYNHVNFGDDPALEVEFLVQGTRQQGNKIEIRESSPTGQLLTTVNIPGNTSGEWMQISADVPELTGKKNIYVVYRGSGYKVDNFRFLKASSAVKTLKKSTLSVYPNPATDVVHISTRGLISDSSVQIHDISGRVVLSATIKNTDHVETTIDISQLPAGIYFVSIPESGREKIVRKLVVRGGR